MSDNTKKAETKPIYVKLLLRRFAAPGVIFEILGINVSIHFNRIAEFEVDMLHSIVQILQPLLQNSLPLNGTGVNTWACHVVVLLLKQRRSLHRHLLYSQLLTSEFDDTVSCLLKALQPTSDYVSPFTTSSSYSIICMFFRLSATASFLTLFVSLFNRHFQH